MEIARNCDCNSEVIAIRKRDGIPLVLMFSTLTLFETSQVHCSGIKCSLNMNSCTTVLPQGLNY